MTYANVVERLDLRSVCLGGCGRSDRAHRGTIDVFQIIHWRERRLTRRGLRRLLLLVAKRERLAPSTDDESAPTRGWLNTPGLAFFHLWADEQRANELAARLGVRFPVEFSRTERVQAWLALEGRTREYPAIWAWGRRGLAA